MDRVEVRFVLKTILLQRTTIWGTSVHQPSSDIRNAYLLFHSCITSEPYILTTTKMHLLAPGRIVAIIRLLSPKGVLLSAVWSQRRTNIWPEALLFWLIRSEYDCIKHNGWWFSSLASGKCILLTKTPPGLFSLSRHHLYMWSITGFPLSQYRRVCNVGQNLLAGCHGYTFLPSVTPVYLHVTWFFCSWRAGFGYKCAKFIYDAFVDLHHLWKRGVLQIVIRFFLTLEWLFC